MDYSLQVTELIAGQPKYSTHHLTAGISRFPTTPGQHVVVLHSPYLFSMDENDQRDILWFVHEFAQEVKTVARVKRCGLAYDGHQCLHIIPMHGLNENWTPLLAPSMELEQTYPGYITTMSGSHMEDSMLDSIQQELTKVSGWITPDQTFWGDDSDDNLFARLIRGQIPQWRVWEDDQHLAFLTPFASTPGNTVLIPRQHLSSDIFGLQRNDFESLMSASRKVVKCMEAGLKVRRIVMFFEGFEIDYAHVKFVPIYGDQAPEGPSEEYHETYPGYISTRLGPEEKNLTRLEMYK